MRHHFHDELAQVEALIVRIASRVSARLDDAIRALTTADLTLAHEVIIGDDEIDAAYLDVRGRIFTLMATQAPVASDLRLVSAILHINIHLERMSDLCTTIGKVTKLVADLPHREGVLQEIAEMGAFDRRLLQSSISAFSKRDLPGALELAQMDDAVDRLNRRVFKEAMQYSADDDSNLEWTLRMALVARQLERFGDHAVDIGEEVAFLVTGEFIEFTDASHGV